MHVRLVPYEGYWRRRQVVALTKYLCFLLSCQKLLRSAIISKDIAGESFIAPSESFLLSNQIKLRRKLKNILSAQGKNQLPLPPHTPGLFVHLGKTGGSTLTKVLRHGCHSWVKKPCNVVDKETVISKLTTYIHTPDIEQMDLGTSLPYRNMSDLAYSFVIMTVRDPLERLLSAFVFEHPSNKLAVPALQQRFQHVFSCFPTLQTFADALVQEEELLPNSTLTDDCRMYAQSLLQHGDRKSMHFYYDYRLITRLLWSYGNSSRPLLLLRTEHLYQDWVQANEWLGDSSAAALGPEETFPARKFDTSQQKLLVDKNIDSRGRKRICEALHEEYRVYVGLIQSAVNLSPRQRQESLKQARVSCPDLRWSMLMVNTKS